MPLLFRGLSVRRRQPSIECCRGIDLASCFGLSLLPCVWLARVLGYSPIRANCLLGANSRLVVVGLRLSIFVCACWYDSFVESRLACCVPLSSSFSIGLARVPCNRRRTSSALSCGVTRVQPSLGLRRALFSEDLRAGCFSCVNGIGIGRSFCGASPASGPASGPASAPSERPSASAATALSRWPHQRPKWPLWSLVSVQSAPAATEMAALVSAPD